MLSPAELIVSSSWPGQVWARLLAQDGQYRKPGRRPAPAAAPSPRLFRPPGSLHDGPSLWHSVMLQSPRARSEVQPIWSKRN